MASSGQGGSGQGELWRGRGRAEEEPDDEEGGALDGLLDAMAAMDTILSGEKART